MKKSLIVVVAVVVVAAAVVGGWYVWHRKIERESGPVRLHGSVDIKQVSLAFDASGRVVELNAQEGDHVKAGAVLARLDSGTQKLEADRARAEVEIQRQRMQRLRHGSTTEEIAQARSRLAAAQADATRTDAELARLREISSATQGRGVSAQDMDRSGAAVQMAHAKVQELSQALRQLEGGPRREDLAAADAQVKSAQAQLDLLLHRLEQSELKSPIDGVVRSRLLEPGDMASPQRPAFALAIAGPKWLRVYLSEPDLGHVSVGMAARVLTDSNPTRPLRGVVAFVSPIAEFTPKSVQTEELRTSLVYELRVRVDGSDAEQLRMGQPATVELDLQRRDGDSQ